MSAYDPKHFTVIDPRTFDGDPYSVAQRACEQAAALAELSAEQADLAYVMARNASMERDLQAKRDPDPAGWEDGPHGRAFAATREALRTQAKRLRAQAQAAAFNTKRGG